MGLNIQLSETLTANAADNKDIEYEFMVSWRVYSKNISRN